MKLKCESVGHDLIRSFKNTQNWNFKQELYHFSKKNVCTFQFFDHRKESFKIVFFFVVKMH